MSKCLPIQRRIGICWPNCHDLSNCVRVTRSSRACICGSNDCVKLSEKLQPMVCRIGPRYRCRPSAPNNGFVIFRLGSTPKEREGSFGHSELPEMLISTANALKRPRHILHSDLLVSVQRHRAYRVVTCAGHIRVAQPRGSGRELSEPVYRQVEGSESKPEHGLDLLRIGRLERDDQVESTKNRTVQKLGVICRRNEETAAHISVDELEEGRDNPPHLTNILSITARFGDGVELVEQVHTWTPWHLSKNGSEMVCCCAEKPGKQGIDPDRHQREAHFPCDGRRGQRLSASRWAVEQEPSTRADPPFFQACPRSILTQRTLHLAARLVRKDDIVKSLFTMATFEDVRELTARLGNVDDGTLTHRPWRRHLRDDRPKVFGNAHVARCALRRRKLKRCLVETCLVAFGMRLEELSKDIGFHRASQRWDTTSSPRQTRLAFGSARV